MLEQPATQLRGVAQFRIDVEKHQIGFDVCGINSNSVRTGDGFRKQAGVLVIFGKAFDIVLERIDGCRCHDSRLSQRTAEEFSRTAGAGNVFL